MAVSIPSWNKLEMNRPLAHRGQPMARRVFSSGGAGAGALLTALSLAMSTLASDSYVTQANWVETMLRSRSNLGLAQLPAADKAFGARKTWFAIKEDFPVEWDWAMQDGGGMVEEWFLGTAPPDLVKRMVKRAAAELGARGLAWMEEADRLDQPELASEDRRWLDLYVKTCLERRRRRLQTVVANVPKVVFIKHPTIRPSFFAYTEGLSDAQNERHFLPGSELCLLDTDGLKTTSLVSDPTGAIRDPAVSWDGQRILFAWKKSLDNDDYHLYELDTRSNQVAQITSGIGYADYEPAYLPDDSIVFSSTRCVQTVNCWWTEVSNLYTCDAKGRFLRRLGFDQVHTVYPQVTDDGRVIYTRWECQRPGPGVHPGALPDESRRHGADGVLRE